MQYKCFILYLVIISTIELISITKVLGEGHLCWLSRLHIYVVLNYDSTLFIKLTAKQTVKTILSFSFFQICKCADKLC